MVRICSLIRGRSSKMGETMHRLSKAILMTGLVLCMAGAASAQMFGRPPEFRGVWSPVVGAGSAYNLERDGKTTGMEIAIVGKEADGYWFESTFGGPRGQIIMKQLMVVDGPNTRVDRMIFQSPGQQPMEMSVNSPMMAQKHEPVPSDIRKNAKDMGEESITTPAGTFVCHHYRSTDKDGNNVDVWVSPKISPWGLVKSQSKDSTMTLTKVITDAQDKITGTPRKMDFPGMSGQRPQ